MPFVDHALWLCDFVQAIQPLTCASKWAQPYTGLTSLSDVQFERDDAAEIEQKVKNLVTVYELPGLAPKIDIQPHIQEAITKVRLSCQHNVCLCLH